MRFITTEKIPALLQRLVHNGKDVWAPQVIKDTVNAVLFAPWSQSEEIILDNYSALSAKELIMPATEQIFTYHYQLAQAGEKIEIKPARLQETEIVLFGARVCDAKALVVLDALFGLPAGKAFNDPYYRARRSRLTVITIACTTCDAACFCSSWEKGPRETAGSDLILYPVAGGYLAEAVSEKGKELLAFDLFTDTDQEKPALATTAVVKLEGLEQKLLDIFSDLDFWQSVTEKCVSCGYCTYACPTCYCFNIFDEMRTDREGERCRSWDACMFYTYTLETSGHNPRPTIAHRYRNRINHKFSYYPANQGQILCTGCGRCIRGCPVGLDIREVITAAAEHQ